MATPVRYLVQFVAAILIVGGGITIARYMVNGEHCIYGWLIVILGMVCLIIGSRFGNQDIDTRDSSRPQRL